MGGGCQFAVKRGYMARRDALPTAPTQCRSFSCTNAVGLFTICPRIRLLPPPTRAAPLFLPTHLYTQTMPANSTQKIPRSSEKYDYGYDISVIFAISKRQNATYATRPNDIKYVNEHLENGEKCITFTKRKAGICIACVSPLLRC